MTVTTPALDPRTTALLVLNCQRGILASLPGDPEALPSRVAGAVADMRADGAVIAHVRVGFTEADWVAVPPADRTFSLITHQRLLHHEEHGGGHRRDGPCPRQIRMGENVPMTTSAGDSGPVRIVAAVLRDGDRVLLCHRSATRRWYPDVWDLPGGHVEEGEDPKESLVRELREELGITASEPSGPPMRRIWTATFDMRIWLVDSWAGTPVNAAPEEHDAVAWFETSGLGGLRLAHESYLSMLTAVLAT